MKKAVAERGPRFSLSAIVFIRGCFYPWPFFIRGPLHPWSLHPRLASAIPQM